MLCALFVPSSVSAARKGDNDRAPVQHTVFPQVNGEGPVQWEQSAPKAHLSFISFRKCLLMIFQGSVFQNLSHKVI